MSAELMMPEPEDEGSFDSPKALSQDEIKAIVSSEIEEAIGWYGSTISEQQRLSLSYYNGEKLGNEVPDRSQVVSRDVLETVEWAMPSLMRMLTGGNKIVEYRPRAQTDPEKAREAEQNAKDATEFVNYLFMEEMDGFQLVYDWIKTALLEKNGVVKPYWDVRRYPEVCRYEGLTADELAALLANKDYEPIAADERQVMMDGAGTITVYDVTLRKWQIKATLRVDGIPPEEFMIARRAIKLDDDTSFSGHRKKTTVSELVAMGFDFETVASIPYDDGPDFTLGRTERHLDEDDMPFSGNERMDKASREVWVSDCYVRIDEDGDGYAELRNILAIGSGSQMTILADEEIGMNPLCSLCAIPTPYKFYGHSLADLVKDIQVIRSTVLRQIMDHIYLTVWPRTGVVNDEVNYDDLLTVRPGGIVRMSRTDALVPIESPPLPPVAFELFDRLETIRGNRTGIVAHGTEIDASAINSTATGLAQLMAEKAQKLEMLGRLAANSMKKLFRTILRIVVENDTKERQVYLNGRWLTINPARWASDMECEVVVGLGAGQALEKIAQIEKIMAVQAQMVQAGAMGMLVTPENIFQTASALVEVCGFKNPFKFFTNPEGKQPPPPPPDPQMEKVKLEAQVKAGEQRIKEMELQLATVTQQHLDVYRFAEMESKERVEMERIQMEERVRLGQQEATLEAARITAAAKADEGEGDGG